jgi:hypothetical protein
VALAPHTKSLYSTGSFASPHIAFAHYLQTLFASTYRQPRLRTEIKIPSVGNLILKLQAYL